MRQLLIAGNWKMHGSVQSVQELANGIGKGASQYQSVEILVIPTFIHLELVKNAISRSSAQLGAQNLYTGDQGAFTGEVSGSMLKDLGCQYVLIGHSERRTIFKEDLSLLAAKFKAALDAGLKPILCVGETKEQREAGETNKIVQQQINSVIDYCGIDSFKDAVVAYEPVWAIGTGLTATPESAQAVHADIRALLAQNNVAIADTIRILYGGSMKPENAPSLLAMPDIDGGLIGGASLKADSFLAICSAAFEQSKGAKVNS